MITASDLRKIISYDADTGIFIWRHRDGDIPEIRRWNTRYAGMHAGCQNAKGYVTLHIDHDGLKKHLKAHRLAWLYVTGEWPAKEVDHINLIKSDNRWANLREATPSQNLGNR